MKNLRKKTGCLVMAVLLLIMTFVPAMSVTVSAAANIEGRLITDPPVQYMGYMCLNYIAWKFRLADLSSFQIRTYAVYRFFCIRRKILNRAGGDRFSQFLASEVSELCQSKALLKKENQKLQEMSAAMKALSKNVVTLTRAEETLSMKMQGA